MREQLQCLRTHPDTYEVVCRKYLWMSRDYPVRATIQQIYNTLRACTPDIHAAVAEVRRGTERLLEMMRRYPEEAERLADQLYYVEEFFEKVQETSAYLQNREPARQAALARFYERL